MTAWENLDLDDLAALELVALARRVHLQTVLAALWAATPKAAV